MAVGTPVTIAVRPEDIVVQGVTRDQENAYEAGVRGLEFLGSFVRADLISQSTGDGCLRADLSINLVRRQSITEGDSLLVRLPRERILIYPGSASRE
jgi:iron(III) transport system ATP-binding protein